MEIKGLGFEKTGIGKEAKIEKPKKEEMQFAQIMKDALHNVNKLQTESDEYRNLLITGELESFHELTIAQEKANIALQLTLSIRNKVLDAYREIMRMQI